MRARERAAIIAFYNAMGGPDWIQRDFWGSDRPDLPVMQQVREAVAPHPQEFLKCGRCESLF